MTPTLAQGELIADRYELIEELGHGAIGRVFRATDHLLLDPVAIKLYVPHGETATDLMRFKNEVRLARRLGHPHIVNVFDFGEWRSWRYLVMEYVDGRSLCDMLDANPEGLPLRDVVSILLQVSTALDYAHGMGVVHRDLKPANILRIAQRGVVKLTDFGSARALDVEKGLTATGETVGTPRYMAPEQLCGGKPDGRVDIYALGLVAFHMATGNPPFQADTFAALVAQQINHPLPRMAKIVPTIPKWFQEFVETCGEKRPQDRFQSAAEAAEVLAEHAVEVGIDREALLAPLCRFGNSSPRHGTPLFQRLAAWFK